MKEIGKLIELLNEYLKKEDKSIYTFYWDSTFNCINRFNGERSDNEWICSKKFGFIKWLVENDKINTESGPLYGFHFIMHNRQPYSLYETILMILAISDTPIEDLVSYLK